jgi:hypothetical protein
MESVTPYQETEALLALLDGNEERCQEILDQMLPGELKTLARHCHQLQLRTEWTLRTRRKDHGARST